MLLLLGSLESELCMVTWLTTQCTTAACGGSASPACNSLPEKKRRMLEPGCSCQRSLICSGSSGMAMVGQVSQAVK